MEIKYVDSALANNFGTHIELNRNLVLYPKLHDAILEHELSHTNTSGFTKKDFLLDIRPTKVNTVELIKFMIKHPKSFLQLVPIYKKEDKIIYDINMILTYSFALLVIFGSIILFSII